MNAHRPFLICVVLVALSVAGATASAAKPSCPVVAGSDAVLKPGAHLLLGETHGTREIPRVVADLACAAAKLGPLRVGLEIAAVEQARIDAFIASAGTAEDRARLHDQSDFWNGAYQDGRRSEAVLALLESLRALRQNGADVRVIAYDGDPGNDRDAAMATMLERAFKAEPHATFLMLSGNLHARKTSGRAKQAFMADYMVKSGAALTTLDARYSRGTAWVCFGDQPSDCGPNIVGAGRAGTTRGIALGRTADGAYDGTFDVGTVTFAAPAFVQLSTAQAARIPLLQSQIDARNAYDGKEFRRCADLYATLAKRDGAHYSLNAYNAACCYAQAGDAEHAFAQLSDALDHGAVDATNAAGDRDLQSLHADARWNAFMTRLQAQKPPTH